MSLAADYARYGHTLLTKLLAEDQLGALRAEADRLLAAAPERGGARHALEASDMLRELAQVAAVVRPATEVLGAPARAAKLTIFDKTGTANWKVPFHQDLTITVRERREVPGFGPWSVKGGVVHVQPPESVLASIVALRLHLDDAGPDNGALRVIDGSHRRGRLGREALSALVSESEVRTCPAGAGDAMLLSPLLVHASSPATAPSRRRVLHFEFTAVELPGGLLWR